MAEQPPVDMRCPTCKNYRDTPMHEQGCEYDDPPLVTCDNSDSPECQGVHGQTDYCLFPQSAAETAALVAELRNYEPPLVIIRQAADEIERLKEQLNWYGRHSNALHKEYQQADAKEYTERMRAERAEAALREILADTMKIRTFEIAEEALREKSE